MTYSAVERKSKPGNRDKMIRNNKSVILKHSINQLYKYLLTSRTIDRIFKKILVQTEENVINPSFINNKMSTIIVIY